MGCDELRDLCTICNDDDAISRVPALELKKCKICDLQKFAFEMSRRDRDRNYCNQCITDRNKRSKLKTLGKTCHLYASYFKTDHKKRKP